MKQGGGGARRLSMGADSDLDYVMHALGDLDANSQRKSSLVRPAAKSDRRARVEDMRDKLGAVWEALGVSDDHRSRFHNMLASMSSKPQVAL